MTGATRVVWMKEYTELLLTILIIFSILLLSLQEIRYDY